MLIAAKYKDVLTKEVEINPVGLPAGYTVMDVEKRKDGKYYETSTKSECYINFIKDEIKRLESAYGLTRVIRENILTNPEGYSEFNVWRATEIEQLSQLLRKNQ